jgi:hypothetical protein
MNINEKNESGFSAIELIMVIVIIGLIGAVGYLVYRNHHKSTNKAVTSQSVKPAANNKTVGTSSNWKTYTNNIAGLTFQYPSNWKINSSDLKPLDDGTWAGVSGSVTSPNNNKLIWIFQVVGGRGGNCEPNSGDVAFSSNNNCSSKEIISVEKLKSLNASQNKYSGTFEGGLYITKTKFSPSSNLPSLYPGMPSYSANTVSYQYCLDPSYNDQYASPPKVGTKMGLLFPCEYWDTGFNAMFTVNGSSGFDSSDAQTALNIMKSFNRL